MFTTTILLAFCSLSAPLPHPGPDELPAQSGVPDVLRAKDGSRITTPEQWEQRRGEILDMLAYYEYGHMPPAPGNIKAEDVATEPVFDGKAALKRMTLTMGPDQKVRMQAALYIPAEGKGPYPVILVNEPVWGKSLADAAEMITSRGHIFAGFDRHDLDKDNADRSDGVHPIYPEYDWATLAVWAWGASRMIDYLETEPRADVSRILHAGHSRGGKAALWAAANDKRITVASPHQSGCGGAGSFRIHGPACETLDAITDPKRFHYWFQPRLRDFVGKEDRLPFDQHFLKALIAPRVLLSQEAHGDLWANPKGTVAMWRATQPVYDMLDAPKNNLITFRPGVHAMALEDWMSVVSFADHFFFGKPFVYEYNNTGDL